MSNQHRTYIAAAGALWGTCIVGTNLTDHAHRVFLSAAIAVTVIAYVDRRASDRDVLLRVGLWTGAATERHRCTMLHDPDVERGTRSRPAPDPVYWAVDSVRGERRGETVGCSSPR